MTGNRCEQVIKNDDKTSSIVFFYLIIHFFNGKMPCPTAYAISFVGWDGVGVHLRRSVNRNIVPNEGIYWEVRRLVFNIINQKIYHRDESRVNAARLQN